jgi:hypothetical protein
LILLIHRIPSPAPFELSPHYMKGMV